MSKFQQHDQYMAEQKKMLRGKVEKDITDFASKVNGFQSKWAAMKVRQRRRRGRSLGRPRHLPRSAPLAPNSPRCCPDGRPLSVPQPKGDPNGDAKKILAVIDDTQSQLEELRKEEEKVSGNCENYGLEKPTFPGLDALVDDLAKTKEAWGRFFEFSEEGKTMADTDWLSFKGRLYDLEVREPCTKGASCFSYG